MIYKFLILFILLANFCNAQEPQGCLGEENNFSLNIEDNIASPQVFTDVDISTFNDTSNHNYNKFILGFTQGNTNLSSSLKFKYLKRKNQFCVWLNSVDIKFEIEKLEVYIPSDFKNDSCKFNEVKKHEFEHVSIHKRIFKKYLQQLKNALSHYESKKNDAILVSNIKTAKTIYREELNETLTKFQTKFRSELNKEQQAIDTEENYKKIAKKCSDWLNSFR